MKKELEEITARIEATLTHYEMMEENGADRWSGMRRDDQVDATLAQLAEHGRERVDIVLIALREVATERQMVLNELRAQLEAARSADDIGRGRADSDESEDASAMEEARLFEKLGFIVSRLMRVRYGPVELPSRVKRNQYYEFTGEETQRLLDWLDAAQQPEPPEAPSLPPPKREPGRRARE